MKTHERAMLRRFVLYNDADAFSALSERYAGLVYRVCWRVLRDEHSAADATQEAFLQLARHAHGIHGSLGSWLHRVATGKAIDILRKDKRHKRLLEAHRALGAVPLVNRFHRDHEGAQPPGTSPAQILNRADAVAPLSESSPRKHHGTCDPS